MKKILHDQLAFVLTFPCFVFIEATSVYQIINCTCYVDKNKNLRQPQYL